MMNSTLTPIDSALEHLLNSLNPISEVEEIPVAEARGRVLAEDCLSTMSVPPHACSAMDGYAVIASDTEVMQQPLAVTQRIAAGQVGSTLSQGQAARIFTGAPLPPGANAVVMQENCEIENQTLTVVQAVAEGENCRSAGEDILTGTLLFEQGHQLKSQDLGVMGSVGLDKVSVRRKLKVALLTTGDEIVLPGQKLLPGQIYNSNYFTLSSLLASLQIEVINSGIVKDSLSSTKAKLLELADNVDCIVTTGGVSVGEEDHVKAAVESIGKLELWKLAIKPGKPFASGKIADTQFFGLPGNPVSAFVTFVLLVRPSLLALLGSKKTAYQSYYIKSGFSAGRSGPRQEYLRVSLEANSSDTVLQPFVNQSSGVNASLSYADGLAVVPPETEVKIGAPLQYIPFSELVN
ncbi:MAG: gephyrin-like molybdotransferase Glp [Pseudohongiellaceae bacterium]